MNLRTSSSPAEVADKKKTPWREKFQARMEEAIPWAEMLAAIKPFYPKGRRYWPDSSAGGGLRHANYTANRLNQSTQRDVPGFVDILGLANPTAPVTVNGNTASRKGEYFHWPLAIANSSSPQYTSVSVVSTYGATQTSQGGVYLPKTPEAMSYDSDGNLTGDGRLNYAWDGENRVTRFERVSGAPTAAQVRVDLDYDSQSRRIQKVVSTNNGSLWIGVSTNRYLYDGWNLVAVLDHANNLVQSFTWGSDLSDGPQGAGGVGGLFSMTVASGTLAGTYFYAHDGNGNVMATVNAADGSLAARYDYGPFGEVIRATGPMAKANPFQFSTKFNDSETGLLYYGYRYYDPSTGKWPNRDPIGEFGGYNVYAFVDNDPTGGIDLFGLLVWKNDPTEWTTQWGNTLRIKVYPPSKGGIPWGQPGPNTLAVTIPRMKGTFRCEKGVGCWHLKEVTINFHSQVYRHTDRWYRKHSVDPAWIVRAENDHVTDFSDWATNTGEPLARTLEAARLTRTFPTRKDCEETNANEIWAALISSLQGAVSSTIATHDSTSRHTWGDPNQRP